MKLHSKFCVYIVRELLFDGTANSSPRFHLAALEKKSVTACPIIYKLCDWIRCRTYINCIDYRAWLLVWQEVALNPTLALTLTLIIRLQDQ